MNTVERRKFFEGGRLGSLSRNATNFEKERLLSQSRKEETLKRETVILVG